MPKKSAKKTAKKAVKKAARPKKRQIPDITGVGYAKNNDFHVQFADGSTHIFKGETLDPTLHKHFIGHQADIQKKKLIIPYRGNSLEFTARELDQIRNPVIASQTNGIRVMMDAYKFERLMNIYNRFKDWFTRQLNKHDMNQADVCKATGLSSATMSWLATGKAKPEWTTLIKIMKAFKIDINKL